MFITEDVKKCVAFLCVEERKGEEIYCTPRATGFFVGYPAEKIVGLHAYFVTAKHCVENLDKVEGGCIRINNKTGKALRLPIPKVKWFFHPEDSSSNPIDVAVIPFHITETLDLLTIKTDDFLNAKHLKEGVVGAGNEVFITGLFSYHSGQEKNMPIIRMGNIAMISDEKVATKQGLRDVYLIEARSIGGLSGSPVFFVTPLFKGDVLTLKQNFFLGGLMTGHWDVPEDKIDMATEDSYGEIKHVNMGIAMVTPAIKILETLNQPELQQMRKEVEAYQTEQKQLNN